EYQSETGGDRVKIDRDDRSAVRERPAVRKAYRFQNQGPNSPQAVAELLGEHPPAIKFFKMVDVFSSGANIRAVGHGEVGQAGWELFGPWADGERVQDAIVEAGEEFGLKRVGARAYSSNTLESGWIPSPMPAVYTGATLKPYRQWLPANGYEAMASLGGSFYSKDITDYYFTPYDLGYGSIVKFDHDFIGRS